MDHEEKKHFAATIARGIYDELASHNGDGKPAMHVHLPESMAGKLEIPAPTVVFPERLTEAIEKALTEQAVAPALPEVDLSPVVQAIEAGFASMAKSFAQLADAIAKQKPPTIVVEEGDMEFIPERDKDTGEMTRAIRRRIKKGK